MKNLFIKIIQRILANRARYVLHRFDPFVIAITGSVGKTSTKEVVAEVLSSKYGNEVRRNRGNLNDEIGVPLTVLGYTKAPRTIFWPIFLVGACFRSWFIQRYPKYLVVEMGVDHPGDISYMTSIVRPNIALVTSWSGAHLANFPNLIEYQREKISLISQVKEGGFGIINGDEPLPRELLLEIKDKAVYRISVEDNEQADYIATITGFTLAGMEYRLSRAGYKVAVKSQLLGKQMIYPSLFAFALADKLGVSLLKVGKVIDAIKPMPGRMQVIPGKNDTIIIDDTYNANPASVKAALDLVSQVPYRHRKVVILGSMNELGETEDAAHKEIGEYAGSRCDLAIFVGRKAEVMARSNGKQEATVSFKDRFELIPALPSLIKEGDLILVKASQNNNFLEEIVKKLMRDPSKAKELLVRQSDAWLKKKRVR